MTLTVDRDRLVGLKFKDQEKSRQAIYMYLANNPLEYMTCFDEKTIAIPYSVYNSFALELKRANLMFSRVGVQSMAELDPKEQHELRTGKFSTNKSLRRNFA